MNATTPQNTMNWWHLLFGLSTRVNRKTYALTGFSLMLLKYGVDASVAYYFTHKFFSPLDYLSPLITMRQQALNPAPDWVMMLLALWTLPFFWIGISMSVRRAIDAGRSPWVGILFFIPLINYGMMLALCFLPSTTKDVWLQTLTTKIEGDADDTLKSAVLAAGASAILTLTMLWLSVYLLKGYGFALFFGTPFLIGVISAYIYNHQQLRALKTTMWIACLSILVAGGTLMIAALEGAICIVMAAPLAMGMALLGAACGYTIVSSRHSKPMHVALSLALLPLLAVSEKAFAPQPLYEVMTAIEINAPPEQVWPNVIGFSDLPETREWLFTAGIAYPKRARIEGAGVGAIRYCEFSTGAFVEPITAWEQPYRLAFDVTEQPLAMQEWSPYRNLHPPHLDGTMRSQRGEFRLLRLPNNRTRLEGRTWYELEMRPEIYWTIWSDFIVHIIHQRVLQHIKTLSETR